VKVDNFALSMFQTCPSKYQLRMVEGWTTRQRSAALGFGGAFHEGLRTWYRSSGNLQASLQAIIQSWPQDLPIDDWRTKEKCISTMIAYSREYPLESFRIVGMPDDPLVEVTFTLDTGLFLDCEECGPVEGQDPTDPRCKNCGATREPIEYGGIFDGLVEFSGSVYVFEHKTTSQLGDYYFNQFKPNNQVTGYVWAARQLSGKRVGGAIINAIGVYKVSAPKFKRDITTRSDTEIAEWLLNIRESCQMLRNCERQNYFPMHTHSCTMYGRCEYHPVHVLGEPKERQAMLDMDYVVSPWHYEARDDEPAVSNGS
jgi:hypothetical protein